MYNIVQLNEKSLTDLQAIAKELGITKTDSLSKEDLVYRILDEQAISNANRIAAKDKQKEELTKRPLPEKTITQQMRQDAYDNWETTDDHGMQIFGIAKDQDGKKYYMVKNSWGETGKYKGIWYATENYVKAQSLDFMIHKDALPKDIKAKLGIK